MGIFDKAKDLLNQHGDKVDQGIDKLADLADQRTGNQHSDKIDKSVAAAKEKLAEQRAQDNPPA